MTIGQIFIFGALLLFVIAIAHGFYRVGFDLAKQYVFIKKQDVVKVKAELLISKSAWIIRTSRPSREEILGNLAHLLLPKIVDHIQVTEEKDYYRNAMKIRGELFIGTKNSL